MMCFICHEETRELVTIQFKSDKGEEKLPVHRACWNAKVTSSNSIPCSYCGLDIPTTDEGELGFRSIIRKNKEMVCSYPVHRLCSVKLDMLLESSPEFKRGNGAWYAAEGQ